MDVTTQEMPLYFLIRKIWFSLIWKFVSSARANQARPEKLTEFPKFCSYSYDELEKFFNQNGIETKNRK